MKMIPMPETGDKVILEGGLSSEIIVLESEEFDPPIYDVRAANWQVDVRSPGVTSDDEVQTYDVTWNEDLLAWEQVP